MCKIAPTRWRFENTQKTWAKLISLAIVIFSSVVLIGWMLNITALRIILPEIGVMKSNTSLAFLFGSIALWTLQHPKTPPIDAS